MGETPAMLASLLEQAGAAGSRAAGDVVAFWEGLHHAKPPMTRVRMERLTEDYLRGWFAGGEVTIEVD